MEKEQPKESRRRIVLIVLFLLAIFIPGTLGLYSYRTGTPLDITLGGYSEKTMRPKLSAKTWFDKSFQNDLTAWFQETIRPRGVMIKTCNTLNMLLFMNMRNKGIIVGKGYDLYETLYVESELGLAVASDYSDPENDAKMTAFVDSLVQLQEKLKGFGKTLVYYVAPSKASIYRKDIPYQFIACNRHPFRAVDAIREKLEKTEIPYLICADLEPELTYPSFYSTGIHWSRTYEQFASQRLIELIRKASGKRYRNFILQDVEESGRAYGRDDDLLNVANVFYRPKVTYYQYRTTLEDLEGYDHLRIMIQGDSFADGLQADILGNDPDAEVYQIVRDEYIKEQQNLSLVFNGEWGKIPWQEYLDRTDVIAIEAVEPLIGSFSFGFVDELNKALDSYIPAEAGGDL